MQNPALFISSAPLTKWRERKTSQTCRRRPRVSSISCSASSGGPEAPKPQVPGDPAWIDLARDLGSTSESDPVRPPPQWKLPDDEGLDENAGTEAWAAWNSAVEKPEAPYEERDPRKETDFWKAAARDLAPAKNDEEQSPAGTASGDQDESPAINPDATSTDIWKLARGVTGEMSDLQERLRADLERYNPDENKDQYRDIARELVGPPNDEPWSDVPPVRRSGDGIGSRVKSDLSGTTDAEPGSGWNPDVDWMRFDDVRREQTLKDDAASRKAALENADEQRKQAIEQLGPEGLNYSGKDQNLTYVDETGSVLSPEEVEKAMREGAVFLDESGAEIDTSSSKQRLSQDSKTTGFKDSPDLATFQEGKVPGFIANRFKSGGTYGGAWSGAEEEIKALQEQGIPLRDPKADVESWRSAARELNIEVGLDVNYEPPASVETPEDTVDVSGGEHMNEESREHKSGDFQDEDIGKLSDDEVSEEDEASVWSSWRTGQQKWEEAKENLSPRDPKMEVDMWRASARDLASPSIAQETGELETESDGTDKSLWDNWRSANARWETSIAQADSAAQDSSYRHWTSTSKTDDWGAGMGKKTSSERAAWENWNAVTGKTNANDKSMWWSARADSQIRNRENQGRESANNADEWRSIAREVTGLESRSSTTADPQTVSGSARQKRDSSVDFWKTVAKDVTTAKDDSTPENSSDPKETSS